LIERDVAEDKQGARNVMKTASREPDAIIVLAMHGAPPLDFPKEEMAEFFGLEAQLGHGGPQAPGLAGRRFAELEAKLRAWPRTKANDPFYAGSLELTEHLRSESGLEVIMGFNEFCSPALAESLDLAASSARRVFVITPMMTRGGEHAAVDIPRAIRAAQQRHPGNDFIYVWPFPAQDIARFLADQISRHPKR
jgi:sirohydrochlorin cobaltochelatase